LLQLKHTLHDVTLATVNGGQLEDKGVCNITAKVRFQTILAFEPVHDGNHGSLVRAFVHLSQVLRHFALVYTVHI